MNSITPFQKPWKTAPLAFGACLKRIARRITHVIRPEAPRSVPRGCHQPLRNARAAILRADCAQAASALADVERVWPDAARCPTYATLRGALHELRHEWPLARRWYGRAIRADRHYRPAQQNMRRLYELTTFGRSQIGFSLDVPPAAVESSQT